MHLIKVANDACDGKSLRDIVTSNDPFSFYAELRSLGEVLQWDRDDCVVVTGYNAVKEVMSDFHRFSSARGVLFGEDQDAAALALPLFMLSPPDQTRARKLAAQSFSMRRSRSAHQAFRVAARQQLARVRETGNRFDAVGDLCTDIAIACLLDLIGVPAELRAAPRDHMRSMVIRTGAASQDVGENEAFLHQIILNRIQEASENPEDTFVGALVHADVGGDRFSPKEVLSLLYLGLFGGYEDVVRMLASSLEILANRPDLMQRISSNGEGDARRFVAESIRFSSSTHLMRRTTTAETEFRGVTLPSDRQIVTLIAGCNRDPDVFSDPDTFLIDREDARNAMTFGSGPHVCIGQHIAREILAAAVQEFAVAFDSIEVGDGVRVFGNNIGGYASLPVEVAWAPG